MTKDPSKKERRLSVIAIFCGKDNHDESKCFKKMASLEAAIKKHHTSLDSSSESTSHGHALCASGYSYTASSSSTSIEWFIDSRASYHMHKDKAIFSTMHECNTKKIFVGDDRSLRVVGSGTIPVENGHFSDVLCVPNISCNFLSVYQITHLGEGKTMTFTPHQVVIKDFKKSSKCPCYWNY